MATTSTKNYVVNYTVTANTTDASGAITTLGESLSKIVKNAQEVAAAMDKIASRGSALTNIAKQPIIPQLGVEQIKQQAQDIEKIVTGTARRMNRALYTGITNPKGEQILSKAAQDVTKNSKTIQREIDDLQKSYNKLVGKNAVLSSKNGVPYVRKHDPASDYGKASKTQRENIIQEAKRIQGLISANKQAYEQARTIEDKAAQQLAQTTRQQQQDQRIASKQPITNFAARDLQKIQKFFGDSKSKSFRLNLNADASGPNGALTVYQNVQKALGGLNGKTYTATINAQLGKGFTDVEKRVAGLAQLAASATLPFAKGSTKLSTDQQKQVKDAQARLKEIKNLQAPIQSRLQKNQAIANPTKGIKGQITKDLKALSGLEAESQVQQGLISSLQGKANVPKVNVPVGVRLVTENIKDSLAKIPKQTLPIHGKMSATQIREAFKTATAALKPTLNVGVRVKATQGQLNQALKGMADKALTAKIPPITLKLDTALAVEELARFLTYIRMCSPQTIALQTSGGGAPGKAGSPATGTKQTGKNAPGSTGHQASKRTPSKTTAPSGFNGTKNIYWGSQKPVDELLPKGYHWEQSSQLASQLQPKQREAFNRVQKLKQQAGMDKGSIYDQTNRTLARLDQLRSAQRDYGRGYAEHTKKLFDAKKKYEANQQQLSTLAAQHQQLESLMQPLKDQKRLNKSQKNQLSRLEAAKSVVFQNYQKALGESQPLRNIIAQEENARQAYKTKINRTQDIINQGNSYVEGRRKGADAAYNRASRAAAKYTEGWAMVKDVEPKPIKGSPSSASLQRQANILGDRSNTVARFTENQALTNAITKNWRYFDTAATQLWFGDEVQAKFKGRPNSAGLSAESRSLLQSKLASGTLTTSEQLTLLTNARAQMTANHVAVPAAINKQIAKLEKGSSGSGGSGGGRATRGDAYNRFRKDMFPLTGTTSFGSRTPMAVEMAKGMGMMYAVGGAMSAISNSFGQAMEYQNVMETTKAILQHGTDSFTNTKFDNMAHIVREVGVKTKFSAPEVANAAKFLAMAGFDIDEINNSIRPIADIALIGDTDLGETADKMTNVMTTFNIGAEQMRAAANIMTTTMTRSNTDLMMLAESAKYGGGIANMYGTGSPLENLSNAMAIFGVMGNAGVQGSSAGTALRMMYMNLYNPNKKQAAFQEQLLQDYGIRMYADDAKTQKRSIADIFIDLAAKVPKNKMADVLSRLFRVTALSGASAVANAAGFSNDEAEGAVAAANGLVDLMTDKKHDGMISQLAQLLKANQASLNGNISGAVAEKKQNTLEGLWAQVTSMFTEGVVRAMEQRQGGFEGILTSLRDYLARPETMQMIGNLIDLIVQVVKVMAWFAEIWANLYNAAPGLIKAWITTQMFFTQVGTLIGPITALIGGFKSLRALLVTIGNLPLLSGLIGTGASAAGAASTAAAGAAGSAGAVAANAAAVAATTSANVTKGAFKQSFSKFRSVGGSLLSTKALMGGFKSLLSGFMSILGGTLGLLANPITWIVGILAGLGWSFYQLQQRIDGTTAAQLATQKKAEELTKSFSDAHAERNKSLGESPLVPALSPTPGKVTPTVKSKDIAQYDEIQEKRKKLLSLTSDQLTKDSSKQSINTTIAGWREVVNSDLSSRLALGEDYDRLVGKDLTKWTYANKQIAPEATRLISSPFQFLGMGLGAVGHYYYNRWVEDEDNAIDLQKRLTEGNVFDAGGHDPRVQKAIRNLEVAEIQLAKGDIKALDYQKIVEQARDVYRSFTANKTAQGLTPQQLQDTPDWGIFSEYQMGAERVIEGHIAGAPGTMIGAFRGYQEFANQEKTPQALTKQWYKAINRIIGSYQFYYDILDAGGQAIKNDIKLQLSMLPDGRINFEGILAQIKDYTDAAHVTIQSYADMLATVYKMMADSGLINWGDVNQIASFIRQKLTGAKLTADTYRDYYKQYIANNPHSEWVQAGIGEQQYVDFMMGKSGEFIKTSKRTVERSKEKSQMLASLSLTSARQLAGSATSVDLTKNDSTDGTGGDKDVDKNTNPYKPDQTDYNGSSHYSSAAAKPTVVQISIGTVGHFDHTMIASNAEERDLIAAVETRVAGALERIIADAQNRANTGYTGYMA